MKQWLLGVLCVAALGAATVSADTTLPRPTGEWTVLVYMNGDDDKLEQAAINDFREMAAVDYPPEVNVVVQLDRGNTRVSPSWPTMQTGRFWMQKKLEPRENSELVRFRDSVNMADEATLHDFVRWGIQNFPAKHYALIIWCHGFGFRRVTLAKTAGPNSAGGSRVHPVAAAGQPPPVSLPAGTPPQPVKASSPDGVLDVLFNAELDKAVREALAEAAPGRKLDILAFDSCVMGMLETAYAVQDITDVFVASEELVSGFGFDYKPWLAQLVNKPASKPIDVASSIVAAYRAFYEKPADEGRPEPPRVATLAALDMSVLAEITTNVSTLADALRDDPALLAGPVKEARSHCAEYGFDPQVGNKPFPYVDIVQFVQLLRQFPQVPPNVRNLALNVETAIRKGVGNRVYAGRDRQGDFGSNGLAIYFPSSGAAFIGDPFNDHSYDKPIGDAQKADRYPIRFVAEQTWSDFLQAYFKAVP